MTVTALDVAFVGALAAIAAPLTAGVVARSTQRHERKMRLFEEQRTASIQVLRESQRKSFVLQHVIEWLQNFDNPRWPVSNLAAGFDTETQLDMTALADAFLPEDVRTARREFEKVCWEALQRVKVKVDRLADPARSQRDPQ